MMDNQSIMSDNDPTTARIARRVHALRQQRGYSLEALAARCGVSRSMISLIERGESSPTAVVLERLSAGLGVALASLFEDDTAPAGPLSRRAEQQEWRDPQTGYRRRNVSPPHHPTPLQMVDVELPPQADVQYDNVPRDGVIHQLVYVLEGVLEARSGDQAHRLEAGDCLAMQLDRPTGFRNPGQAPVRYLVVLAK